MNRQLTVAALAGCLGLWGCERAINSADRETITRLAEQRALADMARMERDCRQAAAVRAFDRLRPVLDSLDGLILQAVARRLRSEYDYVGPWHNGEACVMLGDRWATVNRRGELTGPLVRDGRRYRFEHGLARIKRCDRYGMVDENNRLVVPPVYDNIGPWIGGLAVVQQDSLSGLLRTNGTLLLPPRYHELQPEGPYYRIRYRGRYGYFSPTTATETVPPRYDEVGLGLRVFRVRKGRNWGILDAAGNVLVPPTYDEIGEFIEGLAVIKQAERYGYLNEQGQVVVPPTYDFAYQFRGGRARVRRDGKTGYLDRSGREVIPLIYDEGDDLTDRGIRVKLNGTVRWLDANGKVLLR